MGALTAPLSIFSLLTIALLAAQSDAQDKIMILAMGSPFVWLMGMSENLAVVVNTIDAFFAGHDLREGGLPDAALIMNALMTHEFALDFLAVASDKKAEELQQLFRTYPVLLPGAGGLDFRTTVSVIWNVNEQTAYIAPDRPDLVKYQRVTWGD